MSILQYPEEELASSTTHLHVWNNAAFDSEELQGFSFSMKSSWSSLQSSECSKENLSPAALNSSPPPAKPSKPAPTTNTKPLPSTAKKKLLEQEVEKKIDEEIQDIENEIKRLSLRLEALRLEKAEHNAAKTVEKRGRIVAAKFMEPKQSFVSVKKIEETPKSKVNMRRRGMSLGPTEILSGVGRFSKVGQADAVNETMITPSTAQNRRKSCFWKLQEIDEVKELREKRESLSVNPRFKKIGGRDCSIQGQKVAATVTLGVRKNVKKEDGVVALVQPRKLFKEGEKDKSVPDKRPVKPGRVVASRYNQIGTNMSSSVGVDARKRSLPKNDKDGDVEKRCDKKRASLLCGSNILGSCEVRMKKRWEIPTTEIVMYKKSEVEEEMEKLSSIAADKSGVILPNIRTFRCHNESPSRDSGAAKRVADFNGKKSYFCQDEGVEGSICQMLSFAEEDAEEEG